MIEDLKKVEETQQEVKSIISNKEKEALSVLIQAVKMANKKGAFELDDAIVIGNAKNILEILIKE